MQKLCSTPISTEDGVKTISVWQCDILDFDRQIDILTTSAFRYSYRPTPRTLFAALDSVGISVERLAEKPLIDLRSLCHVWLSDNVDAPRTNIGRIGCIELTRRDPGRIGMVDDEQELLNSIRAYFQMLDVAATCGIKMDTIALPLLGSGDQRIDAEMILIPVLNECIAFLKRNQTAKEICFVERDAEKAQIISRCVSNSYSIAKEQELLSESAGESGRAQASAFISYSSPDKNIADNLCAKLERENIKVWYAPRDVKGPYASAITEAIGAASHFIVILSRNSMQSEHVLNEIDLAFQDLPDNIKFKPLRIDDAMFTPSFKYYLSRQHWMDAIDPPLEQRLDEFVRGIVDEL